MKARLHILFSIIIVICLMSASSTAWGQATVLSENFTGFVGGSIGSPGSIDRGATLDTYTQTTGWTGLKIYEAGGAAKLGTASVAGYLITPTVNLTANSGNFSVNVDLQKYGTDANSVMQIFHAPDGVTFSQLGSDINSPASMTTQTVTGTGGLSTSKIKIVQKNASAGRFYIDNVVVNSGLLDLKPTVGVVTCTPVLPALSQNAVVSATITDDGTVSNARVLYKVNGGALDSVTMTNVSSVYSGTISGLLYANNSDRVEFWVAATDNIGQRTESAHAGFFVGTTNISTLHAVDGNGVMTYLNFYARVTGVATVASGVFQTAHLEVYIQDATQGIDIFKSGVTTTTIIAGNSYTVVGQVNQYNGKAEIIPDNATIGGDITDNGASTLPAYQLRTVAQLLASPETYEGNLVGIKSFTKTLGTWPTSATFTTLTFTDDASVNTLGLYVNSTTGGVSDPSYPSDFVGIFNQSKSSAPYTSGYLLIPRSASDILPNGTLPVEMTSFTASMQGASSAVLRWSTATEVNNNGFEVERRAVKSEQLTMNSWEKIGFVSGSGTSNSPKEYTFQDVNLAPGVYVYRIKQIDNDGTFKYSASTQVDAGVAKGFELLSNYPNPFNPETNIRFSVPENGFATLKVFNMLGQEVATLFSGMAQAGHYIPATFNAGKLASGVYFSRLEYNGKSLVQRMLMTK